MIVVGRLADGVGAVEQRAAWLDGGAAYECRVFDRLPGTAYKHEQSGPILVDVEHRGEPVGTVLDLDRDEAGNVWAVLDADVDDLDDGPWFLSPRLGISGAGCIDVERVSLVRRPGTVGLGPVTVVGTEVRSAALATRWGSPLRARLDRAGTHRRTDGFTLGTRPYTAPSGPAPAVEATDGRRWTMTTGPIVEHRAPAGVPIEHSAATGYVLDVR